MNYQHFEPIDFILDDSFQEWVLHPTSDADRFWQTWMWQHPAKAATIEQARAMILAIDFQGIDPQAFDKNKVLQNIQASIKTHELADELNISRDYRPSGFGRKVDEATVYPLPPRAWYSVGVAATVSLLALLGVWYLFLFNPTLHYAAEFGETKEVVLPDGSTVVLNANSSISYRDWSPNEDREIDLNGEAFFTVVHTAQDQKFIVRSRGVGVEVLGTAFNVNNRRGKTQVVLESGKVLLKLPEQPLPATAATFKMKPGDLVEISEDDKKVTKRVVNPEKYAAWTQDVLLFDNVSLREVFEVIQDTYGYHVTVENQGIEDKMFEAEIASGDIDLIIEILAKSFNLEITKRNNELVITEK